MFFTLVYPQPLSRHKPSIAEVAEAMPRLRVRDAHASTFKVRFVVT